MNKPSNSTQFYLLTLKGDCLKGDLSKDIASELDCDFFMNDGEIDTISVKKIDRYFRLKGDNGR